MSKNQKIRNATSAKIKGITFKSQAEKMIYRALTENGITPEYEKYTFVLWDGFTPITPFYDQETDKQRQKRNEIEGNKSSKILVPKTEKVIGIRYTPDFHFVKKGIDIWIEVKGIENDVFYIKKKLFRKLLDDRFEKEGKLSMFFEIYTKKQLFQALQIIEEYVNSITKNQRIDSRASK
jgi:hypothetical protein